MLAKLNLKVVISSTILILSGISLHAQADNRFYQEPLHSHNRYYTHSYIYYPSQQAYYAPNARLWYWNSGNRWHSAHYAPRYLNIDFRIGGIPIRLNSSLPYQEHAYVVRNYYYENQYALNSHQERKYYREQEKYYRKNQRHNRHHDDD